jgi:hypothetical protein
MMRAMALTRRQFLWGSGAVTLGFLGLRTLVEARSAPRAAGYGGLVADPDRLLDLPPNFSYRILSRTGEKMDDGFLVPGGHDGMAAFPGPDGRTVLVRNHELLPQNPRVGPFGRDNELLRNLDPAFLYDAGRGKMPGLGGTTTLVYNTRERRLERHFLSLAGTWRNCAGGTTPWGSWVTCEESVQRAADPFEKDHGFNFEVPARPGIGLAEPVPLKAMGRFNHEAVAVDPASGVVYETEDRGAGRPRLPHERGPGLFYRFLPEKPGELARGGRLQALALKDLPGANTTNWGLFGATLPRGQPLDVGWIDLENVESPDDSLRHQGAAKGAAVFTRGEGLWAGRDGLYFCCTDGGRRRKGQVWRYVPSPEEGRPGEASRPGRLELFLEPNYPTLLENGDNIAVAPWGDLVLCEDGPGGNFVVGVTPAGLLYPIARNALNFHEFCGACFSPDGSTLFVNIQTPGLTLAVTGPWPRV